MAIRTNNTTGIVLASSGDFTILQNTTTGRVAFTAIDLHDYNGTGDTIDLFVSNDATSAVAERIEQIVLSPNETIAAISTPVVLGVGQYLLGNALTGGTASVKGVYTAYTGDS